MTQLLERAFSQAARLPEDEQDEFARHMLLELESEERWKDLFDDPRSDDLLTRMADEALAAKRSRHCRSLPTWTGGSDAV